MLDELFGKNEQIKARPYSDRYFKVAPDLEPCVSRFEAVQHLHYRASDREVNSMDPVSRNFNW